MEWPGGRLLIMHGWAHGLHGGLHFCRHRLHFWLLRFHWCFDSLVTITAKHTTAPLQVHRLHVQLGLFIRNLTRVKPAFSFFKTSIVMPCTLPWFLFLFLL